MPNTREKLIELCEDVILSCKSSLCDDCEHNCIDYPSCMGVHFADHLIANGVTVGEIHDCHWATEQAYKNGYEKGKADAMKWISVKDRLPEPFVSVLVQMPGEKPFPTVREGFISSDGIWQSAMFRREPGEVTHWQPMPQPPKGE